jgi:hypothetical protein
MEIDTLQEEISEKVRKSGVEAAKWLSEVLELRFDLMLWVTFPIMKIECL